MKRRIIRASSDSNIAVSNRMKAQVEDLFDRAYGGKYLEAVYVRDATGRPDIRIQLDILGSNAVIYLYKDRPHMGTIECHPPKFQPTKNIAAVRDYQKIMSIFAGIADNIYRSMEQEMKWKQFFEDDGDDSVESSTEVSSSESNQDFVWVVYDEYGEYVSSYPADKEHVAKQAAKELYKGRYEKAPLDEVQSATEITASTDFTIEDFADLLRSAWESANAEWGNSAEDMLEWEDAFYCDESYRKGVAEYIVENIPALKDCNMNQIHVEADEDEDSSEQTFTIMIDGKPVDKVRTWYVGGRWDVFMDEL